MGRTAELIELADTYSSRNYSPLPVVLAEGEGAWVTDTGGRRYLDCLAGYSALNFGHRHPAIVAAATEQLGRLTMTGRAFHNDRLGPFCAALAELAGMQRVLLMNSGAEAVESGLKVARKWGYERKGVPANEATVVVAHNNFHGRTISLVGFSSDPLARTGFGPFTPGFREVPYGDADAVAAAVDETTVAVLIEPVQGEAGVFVPPPEYLPALRRLCTERNVLLVVDEIQSGLGRTGTTFACEHFGVRPDIYLLGKALGGGILPVSAVVADETALGVIRPGEHGSTFGGSPLACAVGHRVVELLATGEFQQQAAKLGERLQERLRELAGHGLVEVRGLGLWAGIDVDPAIGTGRQVCERLAERGVLAKDTHGSTIRLSPPLVIAEEELDYVVDQLAAVVSPA